MVFSKYTIQEYIDSGKLGITPKPTQSQFQPHSLDLRLGFDFYIPKLWNLTDKGREVVTVDISKPAANFTHVQIKEGQYFELAPGEFVIGMTLEEIHLKQLDYMAVMYPRSSVNRRGLSVSLTGIVDAGYKGHLFIPIRNQTVHQIIRVEPGERFVTLVFHTLDKPLEPKDAKQHGSSFAKYHGAKDFVSYIPDKER